jgi:hypothetical protein
MNSHQQATRLLAALTTVACLAACHATTRPASTPSATFSAFAGDWFMHAGDLNVQPDGAIVLVYPLQRDTLTPSYPTLHLRITAVTGNTASAVVVASEDDAVKKGDVFTLTRTPTGIVLTTPSGTSLQWCYPPPHDGGLCGA